jgi:shikimate dehydrogenase
MRKFGLIGFPLGHSFSKLYFINKFISESIHDCSYDNYELEELKSLEDLILKNHEISGLNVTIPYKSEVLQYLDSADDEAIAVGAVNVLKITRNGGKPMVKGFNTDTFGFKKALVPHIDFQKVNKAIVLGTGGSAKAVSYVLKKLNIEITQVSRNPGGENCISYNDLTDEMLIENKLIVNTTPLGMFPHINAKPRLNYSCLTTNHILFDLVYNPSLTTFLQKGQEQGSKTIGGVQMLHFQAEKSWEIWNDDTF